MYQVLRNSRITLNHHGNVPAHANNLRLYEATGVGAMLVTDWKADLHEMFEPEREVAAYRDVADCVAIIKHYLSNERERATIAAAGQQRTLSDHTFARRIEEFLPIVSRYL
jgi:spore maturation protein CgeB